MCASCPLWGSIQFISKLVARASLIMACSLSSSFFSCFNIARRNVEHINQLVEMLYRLARVKIFYIEFLYVSERAHSCEQFDAKYSN